MFNLYKKLCCRAFLTLRRHHELIVNLFAMVSDINTVFSSTQSVSVR